MPNLSNLDASGPRSLRLVWTPGMSEPIHFAKKSNRAAVEIRVPTVATLFGQLALFGNLWSFVHPGDGRFVAWVHWEPGQWPEVGRSATR